MTTQLLANELSNLVQESKRKHNDLRQAAEKSLEELKGLKGMSEAQVCAELSQRPNFVNPLIIACGTRSPKFTSPAIVCLQRMVAARALPPSKLDQVLEALRGAADAGSLSQPSASGAAAAVTGGAPVVDAHLKILQALPALLANYADDICGDLLVAALDVCFVLQASRNAIVNNTAAATLQQLVVSVFEKVVAEDKNGDGPVAGEVETKEGTFQLKTAAYDAYRVFHDLCLITESLRPTHLRSSSLPQTFGLELIESVLTQHAALFATHPEQAAILRARVMPLIISTLKRKPNFATTVRLARILYTLMRRHVALLPAESGDALEILTQLLDSDTALWKRAVCMEVFRGIFADAALFRRIFMLYDADKENGRPIIKTLTAMLVRLSTERPAVIGLGLQSTIPASGSHSGGASADQAMLETGIISGSVGGDYASAANTGVSVAWSSIRVPCIDQLDKTEPPPIPESYIYSLTLTCVSSLSEGLAKFILPLTVPSENRTRRRAARGDGGGRDSPAPQPESSSESPVSRERSASFKKNPVPANPLALSNHPLQGEVKICAAIVDECWPAILATCSTFLYAALDSEYYHGLVRAFQKFAHVAGLLQLPTPRDAFLTTLGKAAVPPNVFTACLSLGPGRPQTASSGPGAEDAAGGGAASGVRAGASAIFGNARGLLSIENLVTGGGGSGGGGGGMAGERRGSNVPDPGTTTLNTRNLLCLRALLNLGIALGPTLGSSWSIVIETLQQADFVLFCSGKSPGKTPTINKGQDPQAEAESNGLLANFPTEVRAVETAASRLIESTVDFPNGSFVEVVQAICRLLDRKGTVAVVPDDKSDRGDQGSRPHTPMSGARTPTGSQHRRVGSLGASSSSSSGSQEDQFALAKLGDIATINLERLLSYPPDVSGWAPLTSELIHVLNASNHATNVRSRATDVLVRLVLDAANLASPLDPQPRGRIQLQLLEALRNAVLPLQSGDRPGSVAHHAADVDIHRAVLEGLRSLLENCGEGIVSGWQVGFEVIGSIFVEKRFADDVAEEGVAKKGKLATRSAKLIRSAFNSLQLICSDFLAALPNSCFLVLVDTLYMFCSQDDDLNIALTTVTFFWVLSDFLSGKSGSLAITADLMSNAGMASDLASMAADKDRSRADAALWMLLLLRLTAVTSDERLELRNSAIQTLLRIFDAYGEKLSPEAWYICIKNVVFKLLASIEDELKAAAVAPNAGDKAGSGEKDRSDWNDTAVVVLNGVADLLASYLDVLTQHPSFDDLWEKLLGHFAALLDFHILPINTATFKALGQILAHATRPHGTAPAPPPDYSHRNPTLSKAFVDATWELWARGIPISDSVPSPPPPPPPPPTSARGQDNQECLLAYVSALRDVYRLIQPDLAVLRVRRMLGLLREVLKAATASGYVSDVEFASPLQIQVLDVVKTVRTDISGVPSVVIAETAELVALAFAPELVGSGGPAGKRTYVALSRGGMVLLESLILRHASDPDVFASGALASALATLARPIVLKYAFPTQTARSLPPWRVATSCALTVLDATLPRLAALGFPSATAHPLWELVATVASGIVSADCSNAPAGADVSDDEQFDVASYVRLRELVIPALGAEGVPDTTRARFAECLFRTSIIHATELEDRLALESDDGERRSVAAALTEVFTRRKGRTSDPVPARRSAMAYVCLDELFALSHARSSSFSSTLVPSNPDVPQPLNPTILIEPPTPLNTSPTSTFLPLPPQLLPSEPPAQLHLRIARAVAPYLILRCALTLRAYAADQPLRGHMPQPTSQRKELVRVLRQLVCLRSEGGSIPDLAGVDSEERKHLLRLYPLIVAVSRVVGNGGGGDGLVGALVGEALQVIGGEFGL